MEKLKFNITINAPKEKVWDVLWNDHTYSAWTRPFDEGSRAVSEDWEEGSRVLFIAGNGQGMYSNILKKVPGEYICFEHIGEYSNGEELPPNDSWSGSMESYTLNESGGKTELFVEVDMEEAHTNMMNEAFPKALQIVKELSEKED